MSSTTKKEEKERKTRKKGDVVYKKKSTISPVGNQALGKLTFKAPCYFSKSQHVLAT